MQRVVLDPIRKRRVYRVVLVSDQIVILGRPDRIAGCLRTGLIWRVRRRITLLRRDVLVGRRSAEVLIDDHWRSSLLGRRGLSGNWRIAILVGVRIKVVRYVD